MTFDEWLNTIEVYSTRRERLLDALDNCNDRYNTVISWMEAAYQMGYEHAKHRFMDDGK